MTIPSTPRKAGPLLGNGSQTAWPFTFKVFAESDILVTIANDLGVETVGVLNTDYTVTLNPNQETSPGGTVTWPISGDPLPTGSVLSITGNLEYDQPLDLPSGGDFSPLALENELDRLTMQIQQLREQVGRALLAPVTSEASGQLPQPEAAQLIGWDQLGTGLQNYDIPDLFAAAVYADWVYDTFTGDGVEDTFVLQRSPGNIANCDVSVDGQTYVPATDFTISGDVLVFTTPPSNGAEILVRYGQAAQQISSTFSTETQTATAGQTVFNLTSATYSPGSNNVAVYVNGLRLTPGVDFTETDSNTVTTTSGLQLNDEVLFVCGRQLNDAVAAEQVSYVPAGTGAVAASVQSKLLEASVSIADYSTAQQAVDYVAGQGGGVVTVPVGTHTLTSTLTLASNVQLVGEGPGSVLAYGDGVQGVAATGSAGARLTGISVRNLTMRKTGGTTGQHLIFTFVDDSDISGVTFDGNLGANGAYAMLRGTRRVSADGCVFKNGSSIIWWSSDETSGGSWGEGNSATRCRMAGAVQGFNVIYQRGFTASDCVASGSTGTYGCGFVIEYQNQGVALSNCVSYGHVRDGFYVEGNIAYGCKDIQFIGCIGYSNGEAGLNLDANFKDVLISGGAYYSNTGAFGGATGNGVMAAGSESVTLIGVALHDNAAANLVYVGNPNRLTVTGCKIANAGSHGIYFTGTPTEVKIADCTFVSNTSGNINGWTYANGNEWDDGPWQSWSPTFYKNDETTTVTFTNVNAVFRRNNGRVEYQLAANTPGVALNSFTFFSVPVVGTWANNSTALDALRSRGVATMDVSGVRMIDGAYANDKLRISTTGATDTDIRGFGAYEVN